MQNDKFGSELFCLEIYFPDLKFSILPFMFGKFQFKAQNKSSLGWQWANSFNFRLILNFEFKFPRHENNNQKFMPVCIVSIQLTQ
jgi:hypothetical protein